MSRCRSSVKSGRLRLRHNFALSRSPPRSSRLIASINFLKWQKKFFPHTLFCPFVDRLPHHEVEIRNGIFGLLVGRSAIDKNGYTTHAIEFRQKHVFFGVLHFDVKFSREAFTQADKEQVLESMHFPEVTGQTSVNTRSEQTARVTAKVKEGHAQSWKEDESDDNTDRRITGTIRAGGDYAWHWRSMPTLGVPNCKENFGDLFESAYNVYSDGDGGLVLVEVWYRPESSGKSFQFEFVNPFYNGAINVYYAFGADASSMRNAPLKFVHIEPLQCFDVRHSKGERLYILDWECPDLKWKEENLAGTGKKAWPPNLGVSKSAAEVYERGTTRASQEQIRARFGDLVRGQAEDVAIVYSSENAFSLDDRKPKIWKIFNDYDQRIRVEFNSQAFGENPKQAKPCLIEPFDCYTATIPSNSTLRITALHPQ